VTTNIGILVIGNEILDGLVLDTNSQWIINQLKVLNFHVIQKTTVRDEIPVIGRALRRLVSNGCNLIFTTGGLGPTHDDKTLLGVANAFDLPMVLNNQALEIVTRQYTDLHQRGVIEHAKMTAPRRKMAILPKGANPLDNRVEGAFAEDVIYLPLRDESTLAPIIDDVMKDIPGVYIKSMVKPYGESGIRLWISAGGQSQEEVEEKVNRVANLLVKRCEDQLIKE